MVHSLVASSAAIVPIVIVYIVVVVFEIAAMWKVFVKGGHAGWLAIIPFANTWTLCRVAGRPGWWFLLLLIPFVNIVIAIIVLIDLASAFGKGGGFAAGLILLGFIFFPILGFGPAQYVGRPGAHLPPTGPPTAPPPAGA